MILAHPAASFSASLFLEVIVDGMILLFQVQFPMSYVQLHFGFLSFVLLFLEMHIAQEQLEGPAHLQSVPIVLSTSLLGQDVAGKSLGIIGAGRIGTAFALKSKGFNMKVLYVDSINNDILEKELGAKKVEIIDKKIPPINNPKQILKKME